MKGVVPNYLLFKERRAIYIFSTGTVASRGPSKRGLCRFVRCDFVRRSGALIRQNCYSKQTMTSRATACEAWNNVIRTIKSYVLETSEPLLITCPTRKMRRVTSSVGHVHQPRGNLRNGLFIKSTLNLTQNKSSSSTVYPRTSILNLANQATSEG
jgi:hypothetical protein